jgi:hypothetical protein
MMEELEMNRFVISGLRTIVFVLCILILVSCSVQSPTVSLVSPTAQPSESVTSLTGEITETLRPTIEITVAPTAIPTSSTSKIIVTPNPAQEVTTTLTATPTSPTNKISVTPKPTQKVTVTPTITPTPNEYEVKYNGLLQNSKISTAMKWQDASGWKSYKNWSFTKKNQLMQILIGFETNKPFPIKSPPQLTQDLYMKENDAWMIYITHVAHTLWIEANHKVDWSILDYTSNELALLLDSSLMYQYSNTDGYCFDIYTIGRVTDWNIDISYKFMQTKGYIKGDQESTVYAFASWVRNSVVHITGQVNADNFEKCYGYRGFPLVDKILYPIFTNDGYSVSAGCWGTTGLFSAIMRSVNIPVSTGMSSLGLPGIPTGGVHSRIELPTINKGVVHSDDFYNGWCKPYGGNVVPTEKLFHSLSWLKDYVDEPVAIDSSADYTNRKEDQASFNHNKYMMDLAVNYLTDYVLFMRATDESESTSAVNLINQLSGVSAGNDIIKFAKPFYTDTELNNIVKSIDDELKRLGGGDWNQGAQIAIERIR